MSNTNEPPGYRPDSLFAPVSPLVVRRPRRRILAIQSQRQALGTAARFHEFIQRRGDWRESAVSQVTVQLVATGVGHHCRADDDRIAGELACFRL